MDEDLIRVIGVEIGLDPAEISEKLTDDMLKDYLEENSYFPILNPLFKSLRFSVMERKGRREILHLFSKVERLIEANHLHHISEYILVYFVLKAISPVTLRRNI